MEQHTKPNLLYIFADQWRAQAAGYAGDPNVHTPNIDALAAESVNFENAISVHACCTPYRASLLTGQFPTTNGMVINDIRLDKDARTIGKSFKAAGYSTGYIGKWHLHGGPQGEYSHRVEFIPPEYTQGFDYWKVLECTHDYNNSKYFGTTPETRKWEGYDAFAQTDDAVEFIRNHGTVASDGGPESEREQRPFCLFLSWGPPHDPYHTAPEKYLRDYRDRDLVLRPNVPEEMRNEAREMLTGYYAHVSALDECVGRIDAALEAAGLAEDTIFVLTSDHGDMLGSQGLLRKHLPYDESIRVPFLIRYPKITGKDDGTNAQVGRRLSMVLNTPDIMPTLLGLCEIPVPETVQGHDYSAVIAGGPEPEDTAGLTQLPIAFGMAVRNETDEYRGIRTPRYTYVETVKGPWLLFDNETDPYQLENLCGNPEHADLQEQLAARLRVELQAAGDTFESGEHYCRKWGFSDWVEVREKYGHLAEKP